MLFPGCVYILRSNLCARFVIGHGCYFLIQSPHCMTRGGEFSLPPIRTVDSLIPVKFDKTRFRCPLAEVILSSDSQHAFAYERCQVKVDNVTFCKTACIGKVCDAAFTYTTKGFENRCACIGKAKSGEAPIIVVLDLRIWPEGAEKPFVVEKFCSKKFTSLLLKGGRIPMNTDISSLAPEKIGIRALDQCRRFVASINDECKFYAVGWVKKGTIVDQGADTGGRYSRQDLRHVDSGHLTYHLTSLTPASDPDDIEGLDDIRLDPTQLSSSPNRDVNPATGNNGNNGDEGRQDDDDDDSSGGRGDGPSSNAVPGVPRAGNASVQDADHSPREKVPRDAQAQESGGRKKRSKKKGKGEKNDVEPGLDC